jgi:GMP synthase (glutamine-hydrolysing)
VVLPDYETENRWAASYAFQRWRRRVGASLGIDPGVLGRHPFPGPGCQLNSRRYYTGKSANFECRCCFIDGLKSWGLYD